MKAAQQMTDKQLGSWILKTANSAGAAIYRGLSRCSITVTLLESRMDTLMCEAEARGLTPCEKWLPEFRHYGASEFYSSFFSDSLA